MFFLLRGFYHDATSIISIIDAGHSLRHRPQPTHLDASTIAYIPLYMLTADTGHAFAQQSQATHSFFVT